MEPAIFVNSIIVMSVNFLVLTYYMLYYWFYLIDSYVERLLDRINNGTKAEDRRMALVELQSVVAENHSAQLAFGAMGWLFVSLLNFSRLQYIGLISFFWICRLACITKCAEG